MPGRSWETGSHFFKILLGDFHCRLRIPPAFVKHIDLNASQMATLEGSGSRIWHVQLRERATGIYLEDGWPDFVRDQSLEESNFLVFRYDGNANFTVRIFDKTGCEREQNTAFGRRQQTLLRRGRNSQSSLKKYSGSKNDLQCRGSKNKQMRNQTQSLQTSKLITVESSKRRSKKASENNRFKKTRKGDTSLIKSRVSYPMQQLMQERGQACAESFSKASSFPNCVKMLKQCNLEKSYMLNFPVSFSRSYLPKAKMVVSVLDPEGRSWAVICIHYDDGRGVLSGGWCDVARCNNLEVGDSCVFEILNHSQIRLTCFPWRRLYLQ